MLTEDDVYSTPIGQLLKVSNSVSANYNYYNKLGNIACSRQSTASTDFDFKYTPTVHGDWKEIVYPSGRVVNTSFDDAGRALTVSGGPSVTYASDLEYAPHGALTQLKLGNGAFETTVYNGRLQMTDRKLGNTAGASELWRLENGFPSTGNNGNITSQTLTLLAGTPIETYYEYDGVNRLQLAAEDPTSSPACPDSGSHWCQLYDYDARGNRAVDDESNLGFVIGRPSTFGTDNRIADSGFGYDDRGNLELLDSNERYLYDGENRQITYCASTVSQANCEDTGYTTGKTFYGYDGEGRRVSKTSTAGTTVFVYDASGRLAAEYGGTVESAATRYITTDHLGSTRVITDGSRTVVECKDYLPFGDEIIASSQNGRNGISCYGADLVRQKFTGKERDTESRLDFFGARYFSWGSGRFQSPDAPFADQNPQDPQSWNLYVYVRNNPLAYIDPSGHACSALLGNTSSGYCQRADLYGKFDAKVSGTTRFFAAASATSQALANLASPLVWAFGFSGASDSTKAFLSATNQNLESMNKAMVSAVEIGLLGGENLDVTLVQNEQTIVQGGLDKLQGSDPTGYGNLINEANSLLNPQGFTATLGSLAPTDSAFAQVLDAVRKDLGGTIDFANQSHREAIGNKLIEHIRQNGGGDVAGKRISGCDDE